MKIKWFILALCNIYSIFSFAQSNSLCGFDSLHQKLLNTNKAFKAKIEQFETSWQNNFQNKKKIPDSIPRIIPVIFHIIHNNGPENISDSLIYQQIDILNEDFRKIPGTPGDGNGADTKIEFCLASIDTSGNPTSGITRTVSPCTDFNQPGCPAWPGSIIIWDPSKYLNIWLRKNFGHLGLGGPTWQVEVRYDCVGRNSINNGRVVTHEAGHWLSLYHTFEDGCNFGDCNFTGDRICDTPPVVGPNTGCPVNNNTCTNDVPDLPDLIENYMDYTNGTCMNMFTDGQKIRMHTFLENIKPYLTSGLNLDATGCSPCISPPCPPIADFIADKTMLYTGESINFTNLSYNVPTSIKWDFPGGTPSTSTAQNPVVLYDSTGYYNVSLTVTNAAGSDTLSINNYIYIGSLQPVGFGSGFNSFVTDLEVYNNELYAAGYFTMADSIHAEYIARWNGTSWDSVGSKLIETGNSTDISDMEVFINELYVSNIGHLASWNGFNWSVVIPNGPAGSSGSDITVFNNELYLAGSDLATTDGLLYKWNGIKDTIARSSLGPGGVSYIYSLAVYKNELYIGGGFDSINGISSKKICKYDGTNWYPVGTGIEGCADWTCGVYAMYEYQNELYVGGKFKIAGGLQAHNLAKWDGNSWLSVDFDSLSTSVNAFTTWNNELYVGGRFGIFDSVSSTVIGNIAKWDGNTWSTISPGTNGTISALEVYNNELYAGGGFTKAGDYLVNRIAKWGCDSLTVAFAQTSDTINLSVSGDVQFTNKSSNSISYYWDFGDGSSDTSLNPLHTYWDTGTYVVKLTASNNICSNSFTSTVIVQWNCYPLSNVNFSQNTDTVNLFLSESIYLYANPEILADSILWDFGDGITDTTKNPVHTYFQPGTYTITLTGYSDTCSATATSTVTVINTIGIPDNYLQNALKIYPNPFNNTLKIEFETTSTSTAQFTLYNYTGKKISHIQKNNLPNGKHQEHFNTVQLTPGIYLLKADINGKTQTMKIIKL